MPQRVRRQFVEGQDEALAGVLVRRRWGSRRRTAGCAGPPGQPAVRRPRRDPSATPRPCRPVAGASATRVDPSALAPGQLENWALPGCPAGLPVNPGAADFLNYRGRRVEGGHGARRTATSATSSCGVPCSIPSRSASQSWSSGLPASWPSCSTRRPMPSSRLRRAARRARRCTGARSTPGPPVKTDSGRRACGSTPSIRSPVSPPSTLHRAVGGDHDRGRMTGVGPPQPAPAVVRRRRPLEPGDERRSPGCRCACPTMASSRPAEHLGRPGAAVVRDAAQQAAELAHGRRGRGVVPHDVADHDDRCAVALRGTRRTSRRPPGRPRRPGTYRTTTAASPIAGGSVSRLRCSASASWACWLCRCTRAIARAACGGDLAGGLQVLVGQRAAGVLVQREDADGAVLGGQRQDHRRSTDRAPGAGRGPGRVRIRRQDGVDGLGHRRSGVQRLGDGEASGRVSRRTRVYRSISARRAGSTCQEPTSRARPSRSTTVTMQRR